MEKKEIIKRLKLPPVCQIGFIVKDADKTRAELEQKFGTGPWTVHVVTPESAMEPSGPVNIKLKAAIAYSGSVQIELIELLEGECFYSSAADKFSGPHHLGFSVKNIEKRIRACSETGIDLLHRGRTTHRGVTIDYAYMDTKGVFPAIIELIEMRVGFLPFKMNKLAHRLSAWLGL